MTPNKVLLRTIGGLLFFAFSPLAATEKMSARCVSPSLSSMVAEQNGRYILLIKAKNDSLENITFEQFYFGENMLQLRAVDAHSKTLAQAIPLLSPGVKKIHLQPSESYTQRIDLSTSFPELGKALASGSIQLSWRLTLRDESLCSSQTTSATMTFGDKH